MNKPIQTNARRKVALDLDTLYPLLIKVWRKLHGEGGPDDRLQTREFRRTVEALTKLQTGLIDTESLFNTEYLNDKDMLGAYLLYDFVLRYQQGVSLLGELPQIPHKVLDIGAGCGPFSLAALKTGSQEVYAVDKLRKPLEIGAEVIGKFGFPINIYFQDILERSFFNSWKEKGPFDLIILGYTLSELFPKSNPASLNNKKKFIDNLISLLSPTGQILIVESSQLLLNREVLALRDLLVKEGIPVQAPCVFQGECPALKTKNSPCYAQRELEKPMMIKELQRAAKINLSSLKMSYLIIRNPSMGWPKLPQNLKFYRVISPPVETDVGERYFLCGTDGKKNLGSTLKVHPKESKAFEYLKRGELIRFENALEKRNAYDLVEGSSVIVEAPLGKPLPEEV